MKVILPCYIINEEILELTKNAIFSLDGHELVIIDNGSETGGGYLRALAHTYIRNNTNLGYAKAVNQGLRIIQDEYVAVVNNDIRVSKGWDRAVLEVLQEPKTYSCHLKMVDYNEPLTIGKETFYRGKERWCQGSFFVLRRHEPFYYDENYLNSYDDWDFFHNIRSKGYKTAYTNKAVFQHHHSFTQQLIPEREINNQKNREYFKSKWGEEPELLFYKLYPDQMTQDWRAGFI